MSVISDSTHWVLAETPRGHVSRGVSGNSAPREGGRLASRGDGVSGTAVVGNSVAFEGGGASVGELGVVNGSGSECAGVGISVSHASWAVSSGSSWGVSSVNWGVSSVSWGVSIVVSRSIRVVSVGVGRSVSVIVVWNVNVVRRRNTTSRRSVRINWGKRGNARWTHGGIKSGSYTITLLFNRTLGNRGWADAGAGWDGRLLGVQTNNVRAN